MSTDNQPLPVSLPDETETLSSEAGISWAASEHDSQLPSSDVTRVLVDAIRALIAANTHLDMLAPKLTETVRQACHDEVGKAFVSTSDRTLAHVQQVKADIVSLLHDLEKQLKQTREVHQNSISEASAKLTRLQSEVERSKASISLSIESVQKVLNEKSVEHHIALRQATSETQKYMGEAARALQAAISRVESDVHQRLSQLEQLVDRNNKRHSFLLFLLLIISLAILAGVFLFTTNIPA